MLTCVHARGYADGLYQPLAVPGEQQPSPGLKECSSVRVMIKRRQSKSTAWCPADQSLLAPSHVTSWAGVSTGHAGCHTLCSQQVETLVTVWQQPSALANVQHAAVTPPHAATQPWAGSPTLALLHCRISLQWLCIAVWHATRPQTQSKCVPMTGKELFHLHCCRTTPVG